MITKNLQKTEEYFIQFTDEELKQLNLQQGDKLTCEIEDGSVLLKKFATLEIDISEYSREVLEMLISESVEKDVSVNEVINDILREQLGKVQRDYSTD